ncbi:MAG: flagellar biosynthesis regulator FlaF [Roseovarius sp.]|nr:flagellar biosynthesis regulator FlaF [Roseovarius sp.]
MNATSQAQAAYRTAANPIRTPRGAEYDAFARITGRLRTASRPPAGFGDLAAAIHDNRRLWAILAADAAGEGNLLPPELRARILYLAEFTRLHSGRVLRAGAPAEPLIGINTAVMRGLAGRDDAA